MAPPPEGQAFSEQDRDRIAKLFNQLDVDKDGRVSVAELAAKINSKEQKKTAKKIISKAKGKDELSESAQTMTFSEFLDFVQDQETHLKLAFKQLDRNKDSVVDADEIRAAMHDLGIEVSEKDAQKLLAKLDKDGSLSIDYDEWRDFLLLSNASKLNDIFRFWRRASAVDIGEGILVPDDFTEEEKKSGEAWKTLLAGGVAGCISRTATAPLDRIKIIYQARGGKAASTGLMGSFRKMLHEGGVISMWRGNGVNCLKIAPESAFKFLSYEAYKQLIFNANPNHSLALHEKFIAGACAGATSQTLIYPMEVLKTRMALRSTGQYSSMFDCARKLYSQQGVGVFYRGYIPNLLGILPYAGIDLALYETFKNLYIHWRTKKDKKEASSPPIYVSLTAGACSSVCGQVFTYPLALIRTKMQAESGKTQLTQLVRKYVASEGLIGLYRGIGVNMLKVIPAVSISYACYDEMRKVLHI